MRCRAVDRSVSAANEVLTPNMSTPKIGVGCPDLDAEAGRPLCDSSSRFPGSTMEKMLPILRGIHSHFCHREYMLYSRITAKAFMNDAPFVTRRGVPNDGSCG